VARGVTDEEMAAVAGSFVTPPEAAKLIASADKVVTF
jgi:hypothetical protein